MWSDVDTRLDFLNYSEVADLISGIVRDPTMRPVSIGVFGTWGTGKSTVLNLVEANLQEEAGDEVIVIRFDAWLYQGYDDARASLMEVIASRLFEAAKHDDDLLDKARSVWGRVQKLRALGLLAEVGAFAAGVPTFGMIQRGMQSIGDVFRGEADEADVDTIKKAGTDSAERARSLWKPEQARTAPKEIEAFRKEFESLLTDLGKTLVVFVDNLDRCLPKQTILTLEALRLFLFMDRTAFIVAADDEMVRHSVAEHYKEPDEQHVIDYMDKLIQVPIRVPRLGVQEVRAYLFMLLAHADPDLDPNAVEDLRTGLVENMRQAWKDDAISTSDALAFLGGKVSEQLHESFRTVDRIASILAKSTQVQGNPRIVKRMLNVIRMRARVARARRIPIDETLIAKVALFERCTDGQCIDHLYTLINTSSNGKPELLGSLESLVDNPSEFEKKLGDPWNKRAEFMRNWFSLEPKLAGKDLRPLVYLSRETVPLRSSRAGLSSAAADSLDVLRNIKSTSSPAGLQAAALVPREEMEAVMTGLIDGMRTHADWDERPTEFYGAILLSEASTGAAKQFAAFLRTAVPKLPPWANLILKDRTWYTTKGKH